MHPKRLLYFSLALFSLASCTHPDEIPRDVEGWAPIYQPALPDQEIKLIAPQPIHHGGKIYLKDNFLYQAEQGLGIHVFHIEDPEAPEQLGFIPLAGAQEISIKDQFLYASNFNNLLILDISNLEHVHLVKKLENAFHIQENDLPPESGYFECIDPSKGTVVGWKRKMLYRPKCKY